MCVCARVRVCVCEPDNVDSITGYSVTVAISVITSLIMRPPALNCPVIVAVVIV